MAAFNSNQGATEMKKALFLLTVLLQSIAIMMITWDNLFYIVLIFSACLVSGLLFTINSSRASISKAIGKGLLFGTLTSLTFTILLLIWFFSYFPG